MPNSILGCFIGHYVFSSPAFTHLRHYIILTLYYIDISTYTKNQHYIIQDITSFGHFSIFGKTTIFSLNFLRHCNNENIQFNTIMALSPSSSSWCCIEWCCWTTRSCRHNSLLSRIEHGLTIEKDHVGWRPVNLGGVLSCQNGGRAQASPEWAWSTSQAREDGIRCVG